MAVAQAGRELDAVESVRAGQSQDSRSLLQEECWARAKERLGDGEGWGTVVLAKPEAGLDSEKLELAKLEEGWVRE